MKLRNFATLLLMLFVAVATTGQKTMKYDGDEFSYRTAKELYDKGMYVSAQNEFFKIMNNGDIDNSKYRDDAAFYFAMCSMHLFNKDAEYQLNQFAINHPESNNINEASFAMANVYYRDKKYKNALAWYNKVHYTDLDAEDQNEYFFKKGH